MRSSGKFEARKMGSGRRYGETSLGGAGDAPPLTEHEIEGDPRAPGQVGVVASVAELLGVRPSDLVSFKLSGDLHLAESVVAWLPPPPELDGFDPPPKIKLGSESQGAPTLRLAARYHSASGDLVLVSHESGPEIFVRGVRRGTARGGRSGRDGRLPRDDGGRACERRPGDACDRPVAVSGRHTGSGRTRFRPCRGSAVAANSAVARPGRA